MGSEENVGGDDRHAEMSIVLYLRGRRAYEENVSVFLRDGALKVVQERKASRPKDFV